MALIIARVRSGWSLVDLAMLECQRHGPGLAQLQARPARHTAVPPLARCVLSATLVSQICRRTAAASGSSASGDGLGLPGRSADIAVAMINDNQKNRAAPRFWRVISESMPASKLGC